MRAAMSTNHSSNCLISFLPAALRILKTEKTTVIFAGTEHDGITITANVQSTAVHEVLACVKVGNYVAVITAVTFGDSNPSEILDLFKAI